MADQPTDTADTEETTDPASEGTEDAPSVDGMDVAHEVVRNVLGAIQEGDEMACTLALVDGVKQMVEATCDPEHADFGPCMDGLHAAHEACSRMMGEATTERGLKGTVKRRLPEFGVRRQLVAGGERIDGGLTVGATSAEMGNGDILDIDSLRTDRIVANPILGWAHLVTSEYGQPVEPPIGNVEALAKDADPKAPTIKRLLFRPVFHGLTERSKEVATLWEAKILRACSIGFIPSRADGDTQWRCDLPKDHPAYGRRGFYFRNAMAYEISILPVGMDEAALRIETEAGNGTQRSVGSSATLTLGRRDVKRIAAALARELAVEKPAPVSKADADWWATQPAKGSGSDW